MPNPHTFPTLYNELKTVSIFFLNRYGYLKQNNFQGGTISWSRNGQHTGSISITVNTYSESPYLLLNYKCNEVPINYRVQLVSVPSNLGKGVVWYFICPHTGKRCRKLHLLNNYFYHRSALKGCMYEKQTFSKSMRYLDKNFSYLYASDRVYSEINKKHFKKFYSGKPTKRYVRLTKQLERPKNKNCTF